MSVPPNSERYEKGLKVLDSTSAASGCSMVEFLRQMVPALANWAVEFGYGDVFSRPQLDLRTRQLAAALTALDNAAPPPRAHLNGALNVSCTPVEIVIQQMAVFAGFPAAINGIAAAHEVFESHGLHCQTGP